MKSILILSLMVGLVGCSTMSKEDCEQKDWGKMGFVDALNGENKSNLSSFHKVCEQEHGVKPSLTEYKVGYERGLKKFCTPNWGFRHGLRGKDYNGTCPKELEDGFLEKYQTGMTTYNVEQLKVLRKRVSQLESDMAFKDMEIQRLKSEIQSEQTEQLFQ